MTATTTPLLLLLLSLSTLSSVLAFVPPKPGSDLAETYEPVHLYRQRRNITFDYKPTALHPETCRYLTELECQNADESMQRHQQRHRALQHKISRDGAVRQRRRRRLLEEEQQLRGSPVVPQDDNDSLLEEEEEVTEAELQEYHMTEFRKILQELTAHIDQNTGLWNAPTTEEEKLELEEFLKEHDDTHPEYRYNNNNNATTNHRQLQQQAAATGQNPRVGTFRVLVLLVRFTDHQSRRLPDRYEYQILWNLRIRRWIMQNSYGKYNAFFDVQHWRNSDNTENYYSFGQSGRVAQFQEAYWPILESLDNNVPNSWDWSKYDVDGNGLLDNLIVLHSGYAAEEGGQDCTNGREYLNRIWSHAFSDSNGWRNQAGTYGVEGYMIASGLDRTCDANVAKMGVMTHEYLHTFYLIDLYDYTFQGKGVGNFDIMAYPYGFGNDGYLPVSLSVWAKLAIDWLSGCQEVTSSTSVTLGPAALASNCIKIPLQDFGGMEEYFLVENRQQLAFDVEFWQSGVMIYHIDDAANEQYDRGYPGQGGWPGNGKHYQVAVMQADGNYDLEKGNNNADEGDMYLSGMSIGPNLDGNTWPNTDMYQGGFVARSGLTIEVGDLQGVNYKININFQGRSGGEDDNNNNKPGFPSVFSSPEKPPEEAQGQFRTPDDEDHRMSGKLPQLGWYEEEQQKKQEQMQQQQAAGSSIVVLDEMESSSPSHRHRSWMAFSLVTTLACTVTAWM
ncbi:Immune inhibitor A peptidase M6 [Seminavis robusta]|uniref:Immune inhibitor A peptidase M6 n=1 Tax=Seminavis robusta TaxID=568900 RepID=A0A9N8E739_9STRA|nr:Immune inhibitor A peptidase M6 [Seminavis robusta]|eukprot:Sro735_g194920.1 Immune inhibitor A peptidase M6 (729) ;mRNA; r:32374-34862